MQLNQVKITVDFLKSLESTFINLCNEGRPFDSKLKKIRSYLYFNIDNDCIVITKSNIEAKTLHEMYGISWEPWDGSNFSVSTNGYTVEWHWLIRGKNIMGSSGSGSLKNYTSQHPELPIFNMNEIKLT